MKSSLILLSCVLLSACSTLLGPPFKLGETSRGEIEARLGQPAQQWIAQDGSTSLMYPSSPAGTYTIMARFSKGPQQRLIAYENILDTEHFSQIKADMSMEEVQALIGPPYAPWTIYFSARDELAWEYRYCDSWGQAARFNVLFDGTSKKVRSTLSLTEAQIYGRPGAWCGHLYLNLE